MSENDTLDIFIFSLVPLPTTGNENPEDTRVRFVLVCENVVLYSWLHSLLKMFSIKTL